MARTTEEVNEAIVLLSVENPKLFHEDLLRDAERNSRGLCFECEEWVDDVEPDAELYDCEGCGGSETVTGFLNVILVLD